MDNSVGKALREARLRKKLTVEEVARKINIRADRIVDLENDDYDSFPHLTYARNFLVMYARYLEVDLSRYQTIEATNAVSLGDFEYLRGNDVAPNLRLYQRRSAPITADKRRRWLLALGVLGGIIGTGVVTSMLVITFLRLGDLTLLDGERPPHPDIVEAAAEVAPTPGTPEPTPEPTPEASVAPLTLKDAFPSTAATLDFKARLEEYTLSAPTPVTDQEPVAENLSENPDAAEATPTPEATPEATPAPAPTATPRASRQRRNRSSNNTRRARSAESERSQPVRRARPPSN